MPRVTRTRGELFVARDVGEDLAASGHGELFVAHDPGESTQCTPSGFAATELTPSGFAAIELTPSGFATDELTPSGFTATCYPTLDTTQNAATSSGRRKGIRDSSRMPLLGANTLTVSAHTQSLHMGS